MVANWERINFRFYCKNMPTRGQEVLKNDFLKSGFEGLTKRAQLNVLALEL